MSGPVTPQLTDGAPTRVGVFGGTFDPPHVGHLVTAINVHHALDLDLVILMVANVPWQKDGTREITPAEDRLAMVTAAVESVPGSSPDVRRSTWAATATPPTRCGWSPRNTPVPSCT